MFNDKAYLEVNRDERFYCALLGHALLSSLLIRERFTTLVQTRFGVTLNPGAYEVFLEAAPLRDYWYDLGDPFSYTEETHRRRRVVLQSLLAVMGVPRDVIDKYPVFWTSEKQRKLWSPGRWDPLALKDAGLHQLIKLSWAFNAKPDVLIISGPRALMIEAKVESSEGRDDATGYEQLEIQNLVCRLLKLLVPRFAEVQFTNTIIGLHPQSGICWSEVLSMVEHSGLDAFSMRSFRQLKRFG